MNWFELVWIGLDWFGLVWIGLDWFGLVWIGLDWFGLLGLLWLVDQTNPKKANTTSCFWVRNGVSKLMLCFDVVC